MKKKYGKRALSLYLAIMMAAMLLPVMPFPVLAADRYAAPGMTLENLYNDTWEATLTAAVPDYMTVNLDSTPDYRSEYEWTIAFSDGNKVYEIGSMWFKFPPTPEWPNPLNEPNITVDIDDFQTSAWVYDQAANEMVMPGMVENPPGSGNWFDGVPVSLSKGSGTITWTFTLPADAGIDMNNITYLASSIKASPAENTVWACYQINTGGTVAFLGDAWLPVYVFPAAEGDIAWINFHAIPDYHYEQAAGSGIWYMYGIKGLSVVFYGDCIGDLDENNFMDFTLYRTPLSGGSQTPVPVTVDYHTHWTYSSGSQMYTVYSLILNDYVFVPGEYTWDLNYKGETYKAYHNFIGEHPASTDGIPAADYLEYGFTKSGGSIDGMYFRFSGTYSYTSNEAHKLFADFKKIIPFKNGAEITDNLAIESIAYVASTVSGRAVTDVVVKFVDYYAANYAAAAVYTATFDYKGISYPLSAPSSEKQLAAFSLGGVALAVNDGYKTVTGSMAEAAFAANSKAAAFTVSAGAALRQGAATLTSGTSAITFGGTGTTRTATLTVVAADNSTQNYTITITLTQKTPLNAPTGLTWSGNAASFTAPSPETDVAEYAMSLYKGATQVGETQTIAKGGTLAYDFTSLITINGTGSYTFKVVAKANPADAANTDSAVVTSGANNYIAKLATPPALVWSTAGAASWGEVTGASGYSVQLLKNGTAEGSALSVQKGTTSYGFLAVMKTAGAGDYTFKVAAVGDNVAYRNSDEAIYTGAAFTMRALAADAILSDGVIAKGDPTTGMLPATVDFGGITVDVTWAPESVVNTSAARSGFVGTPVNLPDDLAANGKVANRTVYVLDLLTDKDTLYLNLSDMGTSNSGTVSATLLPAEYTGAVMYSWAKMGDINGYLTLINSSTATVTVTATDEVAATLAITVTAGVKTITKDLDIVVTAAALAQLEPPGSLAFNADGIASWNASPNADGYRVQLYKDGIPVGGMVQQADTTPIDYLSAMRAAAGSYTFNVTALGDNVAYRNSDAAASAAFVIRDIASIANPTPVAGVKTGTSQAQAGLPSTVAATLAGGGTANIPVTWSGYNSSAAATITLTGALKLPNNIINSGGIAVPSLRVTFTSGGGSAPPGSGAPANPTTPAEPPKVDINGGAFSVSVNADGSVTLSLNNKNITDHLDDSGDFVITISKTDNIALNLPISSLGGAALKVVTDFGIVYLPDHLLQSMKAKYGDTLALSVRKGSFIVALSANGKEIAYNDPANPLTVEVPVIIGSGRSADGYVAIKKENGKDVIIPLSVFKAGNMVLATPSTGAFDVIYNAKPFTDISGHWAAANIDFVSARTLFGGIGNDLFDPNGAMTRAMFAQVLANLESANLAAYKSSPFSDVAGTAWYAPAVAWAADIGMINGMGSGKFAPDQEVTREQMAAMLYSYIKYKGYTLNSGASAAFADSKSVSPWAVDAVDAIQGYGMIHGKGNNLYDPLGNATRAEVAAIFTNLIVNLAK